MKYKTFVATYPKEKFGIEESILVEEHVEYVDIKKQYKYGRHTGYSSLDMTNAVAKRLRDILNKVFPV